MAESMLAAVRDAAATTEPNTQPDPVKPSAAPAQAAVTLTSVCADHPDIADKLRAEGAVAERERIAAIQTQGKALPGHDDLIAGFIANNTSAADAAQALIKAEGKTGASRLAAMRSADNDLGNLNSTTSPAGSIDPPAQANTPDGWRAEYEASADLQAEFDSVDNYLGYKEGVAAGRIKIK